MMKNIKISYLLKQSYAIDEGNYLTYPRDFSIADLKPGEIALDIQSIKDIFGITLTLIVGVLNINGVKLEINR